MEQVIVPEITVAPAPPARAAGIALRVLQVGAVAIIVAAATWKTFELDRYFVPKDLVLHATALLAGTVTIRVFRQSRLTRVDVLLVVYLLLGVASALLATNGWLAARALAISASGIVVFWAARSLRTAGLAFPLLVALALAVVLGAATALLQTYGVRTELFSLNRAPGGTLGNRNFIAHLAAFGLPLLLFVALAAHRRALFFAALLGATPVAAVLVLTRSRAGWLAAGAALLVLFAGLVLSPAMRRSRRTWLRLALIILCAGAGLAGALLLPNQLRWNSANPYLESFRGVANYQEGSGQGRLVQYRRSLRMAAADPVFGVGPGNWPVRYAEYAARRDPSLDRSTAGMTANPWPSSDWVAFIAERGLLATVALALAFAGLALAALRRLRTAVAPDDALSATALLAILAATIVAGLFDAVLLLALPTLIVWAALGALAPPPLYPGRIPERFGTAALIIATALGAGMGTVRSAAQLIAMGIYADIDSTTWLARAALIDPGNYRLRVRLAGPGNGLDRDTRCGHARAARALMPNAERAKSLAGNCE